MNAYKYKWSDRWNMLFSTGGIYQGNAHPDNNSHNSYSNLSKEAYGSFKEYWTEVSNSKYEIIPALTHTDETDIMYRTGIANNIKTVNGVRVIQSIMLKKKKYGSETEAYFPDHNSLYIYGMRNMLIDAYDRVEELHAHDSLEFDIGLFEQNHGIVVFIIAGSHSQFKGIAIPKADGSGSGIAIVRGMYDRIQSDLAVIDGITCLTHEFAHCAFDWEHTIGGRNCLMNPNQTKDINCPSHPNPVYKLKEGWANPVHFSNNQNNIELQPIETSKQVGIITIYGNPSYAPDHLSGECYVLENRREIGFDQKLTNEPLSNFKGGLLIWHYAPYGSFNFPPGLDLDVNVPAPKLITPEGIDYTTICLSPGNKSYFFAYRDRPYPDIFYELLQNRTYSQENLKTGIQINNIYQTNYSELNSSIIFSLGYTISLPVIYDYTVINYASTQPRLVSSSGNIFFHKQNDYDYFELLPGARMEIAPNQSFKAKGIKASGEEGNKITFGSCGYKNSNEYYYCKYNGMGPNNFGTFSNVNGAYFKNVHFENICDNKIKIQFNCAAGNLTQIEIENITTDNPCWNRTDFDIYLVNSIINKFSVEGFSAKFVATKAYGNIYHSNAYASFLAQCNFASNTDVIFTNCDLTNSASTNLTSFTGSTWRGLKLFGGGIKFSDATITGAVTGLYLKDLISDLKIKNCTFGNINENLVVDNYLYNKEYGNGIIQNNLFNSQAGYAPLHLKVTNSKYICIDGNTFPEVKTTGVLMMYCNMPSIINNNLTGSGTMEKYGIVSYLSNGSYHCNSVTQCNYGIFLDNSQPILYQNLVHTNGTGMYITNGSYPIMSPAYLENETYVLAGYNHFYNNSGKEIYVKNTI
ncbi:MAG: right-handed parallel beta-helix repeat-containing protein, partial [Ignavibacteria bacterium]|nr:right-handed parallel beta-helix repeat-containing protein [Ignavibacteria bacterium]